MIKTRKQQLVESIIKSMYKDDDKIMKEHLHPEDRQYKQLMAHTLKSLQWINQ